MRNLFLLAAMLLLYPVLSISQTFIYSENKDNQGFILLSSSDEKAELTFSVAAWSLETVTVNRAEMQKVTLPGHFLPNDEGMPDLPGSGRYMAIPQGSTASLVIRNMETEILQNINMAPAPRIPKTTENGDLFYAINEQVYSTDAFYPAEPVKLSEAKQIRGVDVVMLGITPFQYNPVTKELIVIKNLEIEVVFSGGNGHFGDDRLRSRWWEPVLADMVMNYEELVPFGKISRRSAVGSQQPVGSSQQAAVGSRQAAGSRGETGFEYLIICPDDPAFLAWADTIRVFRNKQGISTGVVTTTQTGGNSVNAIRTYINTAFNTWDIPPAAILILGDYGTTGSTVVSPIWGNYCASDNIYGDVNNDDLPDIVMARIFAQNEAHLALMVQKFIDHEINPPVDPDYYDKPVTALGWQTERWFQICIETVGGFFRNVLGKEPVRINAIYDGDPNVDPWSYAPNTSTILNYFGPNGLGYLPASPSSLGYWIGGTSGKISNAINNGTFMVLHRDHGYEQGWGEPAYSNSSMASLDNEHTTFVYSVNCLTGKFNIGGECFAEGFLRYPKRAYGIIAASEVSYSFVNDTYVWGAMDHMWPEFMPEYGTTPETRGLFPAFSNAAGKFFLEQSSWPYNTDNKEVTYHLFHHFGDAFTTIYSEVPQELLAVHNDVLIGGAATFRVHTEADALVALSIDGEIIGVADGTGEPQDIAVAAQQPGVVVDIVITKPNRFRYESKITVADPNTAYVVYDNYLIQDDAGNGNGSADYNEEISLDLSLINLGLIDAENVSVTVSSDDPYVAVTDTEEQAGDVPAGEVVTVNGGWTCRIADSVPDQHKIFLNVAAADGSDIWHSEFFITALAPDFDLISHYIDDPQGNNDGKLDPGETATLHMTIRNTGSSAAYDISAGLGPNDYYLSVLSDYQFAGDLEAGQETTVVFTVAASELTPGGFNSMVNLNIEAGFNRYKTETFTLVIGDYSALVLDLDPMRNSGPAFVQTFDELGLFADYKTTIPSNLSDYSMVFVCLGIYFTNHVLTENEAQMLKNFLEDGGNVYMEGRLTWYNDPQTSLQPMFNISPKFTNFYRIDTVYNIPGTFSNGMQFAYEMTQPYNNHLLHAVEPATEIFKLLPDSLPAMVAYEAPGYKTIGTNIEFGGLVNGTNPSTRRELLLRMLQFFGQNLTSVNDDQIVTENRKASVSVYPNPFSREVNFEIKMDEPGQVRLEIFNVEGKPVYRVFDGNLDSGKHIFNWNTDPYINSGSGNVYLFRLKTGSEIQGGKLFYLE